MKRQILLTKLLPILFIGTSLQAQINTKVNLGFEDKVQSWLTENNVPAVSIGIIEDGKIMYLHAFGELQKGVPAQVNSIFNIASMTKPVVAMMTLKLVNAGQWDLDEPLFHYWVDPDIANDPRHKKLTTRFVLSHQTGFPNWRKGKLSFEFEPGTNFGYSGEGFEYLRKALEKKFHKPLEKLLDSIIFKPLGMKDTRYWDKNIDMKRYAHWHDSHGNEIKTSYETGVSAADLLLTTVEDYCKFMVFVMNGAGLSPKLFNDMIKSQVNVKKNLDKGLGWEIVSGLPNGEYTLQHGGNDPGIKTMGVMLPKSNRGIVVFTNGDNGMLVYNNVIKESIGVNILNNDLDNHKSIVLSGEILESYAGSYIDSYGRTITITHVDSVLKFSGYGLPTVRFYPEAENKFFLKEFDVQIEFLTVDSFVGISQGKIDWSAKKIKQQPEIKLRSDNNKIINDLRQYMDSIASDATEGRLVASSGYNKAAQYAAGVFRKAGLDSCYIDKKGNKSYFQPVPLIFSDYGSSTLTLRKNGVDKTYKQASGSFVFIYPGQKKNIKISEAVFIGYGISEPEAGWDDFAGLDVKGKWVIVMQGTPAKDANSAFPESLKKKYANWNYNDSLELVFLTKHKAAGLIVLPNRNETNDWGYYAFRNFRYTCIDYAEDKFIKKETSKSPLPVILANPELAQNLMEGQPFNPISNKGKYHSYVLDNSKISATIDCKTEHKYCNNVIAVVPGTDPMLKKEYITVCAHLDHIGKIGNNIYHGANDDASGCVILLEAAKKIALNPPKKSVMFILHTCEEEELIGSMHFVRHLPVPKEQISLNINIEQIGSKNRDYPGILGIGSPQFKESFQKASSNYTTYKDFNYELVEKYKDSLKGSVDSWSYYLKGIPIVMLSSGGFPEHHTLQDTIDLIDFDHLCVATDFLNSFIVELGNE